MNFVWVVHGDKYAEQCADSIRSIRYPGIKHVFVDKEYDALQGVALQHVVPGYHDVPFMLMNVLCQLKYLTDHLENEEEVCFLDTDIIATDEDFHFSGNEDWDIAPTWRDNMGEFSDLMPYNYGVLFARRTVNAITAWTWMADNIYHQQPKNLEWYGNQVALRELCGAPQKDGQIVYRDHGYFDVAVKCLPCAEWNYTPEDVDENLDGIHFIHLKGDRAHLWDHYYQRAVA